jgi:hypothetical protein
MLRFVYLLRLEAITAEKGNHVEQWSDVAGTPISRTERRFSEPWRLLLVSAVVHAGQELSSQVQG